MPYLPSIDYYRALTLSMIDGTAASLPPQGVSTRTVIRGAWGEQTLTLPVEGGRRHMRYTPPGQLRLSEHGDWRHTHWQAITSAYGALPYFHYLEGMFAPAYSHPRTLLAEFCDELHAAFMQASHLPELTAWLRENPRRVKLPADAHRFPGHIAALELLFARGPETIFYLAGT